MRSLRLIFTYSVCLCLSVAAQSPRKLTLPDAEALGIRQHPRLAGAHFSTEAAGQVTRESRSALYPVVSGAATAVAALNNSRLAAGLLNAGNLAPRVAGGVALQELVTDFGRTRHVINSSRLREQSQGESEAALRESLVLDIDRAYFRALRAAALLRVAEQTRESRQLLVDQVTALMNANLKSQLDLSFAGVNLAEAQLLEATAKSEIQESFADLSNALGYPTAQTFELVESPPDPPSSTDLPALVRQALDARPDLKGLRLDRDASVEFSQAERSLSRPTVSVAGAVGGIPFHNDLLSSRYGAAGVNVSIPVFNGSLFTARRLEAELRAQAAGERVRDSENQVAKEVQTGWLEVNTAYQRIALTEQLLAQASLALELAQSRYDLGLSSIIELSQAQLNKTSAEIQNLTSRYDYQLQTAALRYQLGQ